MKLEKLKDWKKLTVEEQNRLKKVYGGSPKVTKTMAQKPKKGRKKKNV